MSDEASGRPLAKQVTRARARPPETMARIERIADMMRRLDWMRGVSSDMLAIEWGLAKATVEALAAEAHRVVVREEQQAREPGETQASIGANLVGLSDMLFDAAVTCKETGDIETLAKLGGPSAAVADKATMILGERAPERHAHAVAITDAFVAMPRANKSARLRELAAKLIVEADRLDGVVPALGP